MSGTFLGAIADDVTGATDLAALLARSGVPVGLRLGLPASPPEATAPIEVVALKCRTAPVARAVADCRAALGWLRAAGAERFYWKYCSTFDSTPAGNIGPVAEVLMRDLGVGQTIYCPAFPENGRTVYMGRLFVGQQPLDESPMRDHPLTPMRDASLPRLLAPQVAGRVGLADRRVVAQGAPALAAELARLAGEGVAHVVVDAVEDADLVSIAAAAADVPLLTGGSALAMALPGLWQAGGHLPAAAPPALPRVGPGAVVLSGSCSTMPRAQVTAYEAHFPAYRLDPVTLACDGLEAALGWLAGHAGEAAPLVYATAEPAEVARAQALLGVAGAGQVVEQALARLAVAARDRGVRRFVVAGGETSGAVTAALGLDRLTIGPEVAPGVPWTFGESAGQTVALTLKSGNFGGRDFFAEALARLEAA